MWRHFLAAARSASSRRGAHLALRPTNQLHRPTRLLASGHTGSSSARRAHYSHITRPPTHTSELGFSSPSSYTSSTSSSSSSSSSARASSLSSRATYIVRLERAFFDLPSSERDASVLLEQMNECGFHQRVVDTYERKLTDEEAHQPEVVLQCWAAQEKMAADAHTRGGEAQQVIEMHANPFEQAPLHAQASSPASHSVPPSTPSGPISAVPTATPAPSGVLYISKFGDDPSRLREYLHSETRYVEQRHALRSRVIAYLVVFSVALVAGYLHDRSLTEEERLQQSIDMEEMVKQLKSLITRDTTSENKVPVERPKTRLDEVAGCDEAKAEVMEVIEYLKDPTKFNRLGGKMPKGVLLLGPPGTGKTLLARAIAGEAGVPFFAATGGDFEEKYVGVGSKRVRELFNEAKKLKPAIIFIDEIDAIGGKRSPNDTVDGSSSHGTLHQLLTELDGFRESSGVIVIAATNFADQLDPAILRPGRFDRHVTVGVPDIKGRKQILSLYARKMHMAPDVDLSLIARTTSGMTGADLSHLLNTAALRAAATNQPVVGQADLEYAKDHILMGAARTSAVNAAEIRQHISVYESGKTLVALHSPHAQPLYKVTIVQRGAKLGTTTQTQGHDNDVTQQSYAEMLSALDCRMGGRVAEELMYGVDGVSSNARQDLAAANRLARAMVMRFGFGSSHGPVADADVRRFGSCAADESKASVDEEVKVLLQHSYERAKALLTEQQPALQRLTQALMQHETLDAKQVQRVAKGLSINVPTSAAE